MLVYHIEDTDVCIESGRLQYCKPRFKCTIDSDDLRYHNSKISHQKPYSWMPKENLPASVKMGGVETQVFRLSRGDASRNLLKDFVPVTSSCNALKKVCLAV